MKNNIFFLAVVLLITSCGNAQKNKVSDKITGVFSYTKNGTPAFKIKDTIINGKKKYTIYDYQTKKKLIGNRYYNKIDDIELSEIKKRRLSESLGWEEWLYTLVTASRVKLERENLNFYKVKKGIILEEKFSDTFRERLEALKKFKIEILGYSEKITTGFFVTIINEKKLNSELKILYKLSDL